MCKYKVNLTSISKCTVTDEKCCLPGASPPAGAAAPADAAGAAPPPAPTLQIRLPMSTLARA